MASKEQQPGPEVSHGQQPGAWQAPQQAPLYQGGAPGPAYGQPVVAQPSTTAVIVSGGGNQGPAPQNIRGWTTGLCGCCSDCGSCCYAYWCWCCFLCSLSTDVGEDCCGPCLCGFPFLVALRTKVRTMYGIRGTIMGDTCTVCCCTQCAMCQLAREVKNSDWGGNRVNPTVMTINSR